MASGDHITLPVKGRYFPLAPPAADDVIFCYTAPTPVFHEAKQMHFTPTTAAEVMQLLYVGDMDMADFAQEFVRNSTYCGVCPRPPSNVTQYSDERGRNYFVCTFGLRVRGTTTINVGRRFFTVPTAGAWDIVTPLLDVRTERITQELQVVPLLLTAKDVVTEEYEHLYSRLVSSKRMGLCMGKGTGQRVANEDVVCLCDLTGPKADFYCY